MNQPVVLITGALTGIGRATALAFAREGVSVVVSGRRDEVGHALAAELRALGAQAEYLRADVRMEAEVRSLVEQTVERFGRLDVAVNNAGTEGQLGPVTEQSEANYRSTFDTNVLGTLLALKHEMRVMLKQGAGAIVNLSSVAGQVGIAGAAVYAASKHAVEGLTKSAALEGAAAGVRVNAVAPGWIASSGMDTYGGAMRSLIPKLKDHVPLRRMGLEAEVSAAIVFLLSPAAAFITGVTLQIDGAASLNTPMFPKLPAEHSAPFDGFHRATTPRVLLDAAGDSEEPR